MPEDNEGKSPAVDQEGGAATKPKPAHPTVSLTPSNDSSVWNNPRADVPILCAGLTEYCAESR